jgi:HEPN domain-containing protein
MIELQTVAEAAREWLENAWQDLRVVEFALAAPIPNQAAYHSQQLAEKSIKGLLAYFDEPFGKTHKIAVLAPLVAAHDPSLGPLLARAESLSEFIDARYPGFRRISPREAETIAALAREVYEAVLERVPDEARPETTL